jgi:flagellar biosynthesis chaperone FliJ
MSRKTKPIWEILCLKNENEVKKIKLIFDQVRLKKDQALARKLKLETMLEEYSYKLQEVLKTPKTKHQSSVYRQFIVQVQKLLVFANDDVVKLTESFETVNRKLIEAKNEKLKLEKLAEKQAAKVVHREEKLNAKERDAMNILKYNINH